MGDDGRDRSLHLVVSSDVLTPAQVYTVRAFDYDFVVARLDDDTVWWAVNPLCDFLGVADAASQRTKWIGSSLVGPERLLQVRLEDPRLGGGSKGGGPQPQYALRQEVVGIAIALIHPKHVRAQFRPVLYDIQDLLVKTAQLAIFGQAAPAVSLPAEIQDLFRVLRAGHAGLEGRVADLKGRVAGDEQWVMLIEALVLQLCRRMAGMERRLTELEGRS